MTGSSLSEKVFKQGIERLEAAFRTHPLSEASLKVYYEKLCYLDDKLFLAAIESILEQDTFFPAVARFLEYIEEQRENDLCMENAAIIKKQMEETGYNPDDQ